MVTSELDREQVCQTLRVCTRARERGEVVCEQGVFIEPFVDYVYTCKWVCIVLV